MNKNITIVNIILLMLIMNIGSTLAGSVIECNDGVCVNNETKSWGGLTFTPSFKNTYELKLLNLTDSCDQAPVTPRKTLPKNSKFRQTLDRDAQSTKEMIVHIYSVEEFDDGDSNTTVEESTEAKYFNKPFKICLNGTNAVAKSRYKRIGGVSTGILVVPFKIRDKDVYSDSTIGPYISYKMEVIELLATAGLSQISVSEVGTDKVENKTGLTYALGINFAIHKNWDIAFVVGADHLSGDTGDNWEFQDDVWYSFAIGYNFTR